MKKLIISMALTALACGLLAARRSEAHHSFAMFDSSQHQLIEGNVTAWNYNNPHSWLHIDTQGENGETVTWSFEGAAPIHATRQGVTGNTFRKGEHVRVVMSPIRDGRNAGAMCFVVKEDGSIVRPNDGICDSESVIGKWQSNGWLDSTSHLGAHPAAE